MSQDRSTERRIRLQNLNWFGKSVYLGAATLRLTANLVDETARRVSKIAAESRKEFNRELNSDIENARVIDEYQSPESSGEE